MRAIISALFILALAGPLCAQAPVKKTAAAPAPAAPEVKKTRASSDVQASGQRAEADSDYGTVMIDSKLEQEESGSARSGEFSAESEVNVPGGIPSSYGQCKGIVSEGGRTIMVFESPDDGAIYFVQVTVGKNNVSWKLVDRIARSAD